MFANISTYLVQEEVHVGFKKSCAKRCAYKLINKKKLVTSYLLNLKRDVTDSGWFYDKLFDLKIESFVLRSE